MNKATDSQPPTPEFPGGVKTYSEPCCPVTERPQRLTELLGILSELETDLESELPAREVSPQNELFL